MCAGLSAIVSTPKSKIEGVDTALPRVGVERPNGSYVARTYVLDARSSLASEQACGRIVALTEHQLHGYDEIIFNRCLGVLTAGTVERTVLHDVSDRIGLASGLSGLTSRCYGSLVDPASSHMLEGSRRANYPLPAREDLGFCWFSEPRGNEVRRRSDTALLLGSGESMVAKLKLKGIDGRAPPGLVERFVWLIPITNETLASCVPWPKGPGNPLNLLRARDWGLQLFPMNEEFPVSASHKLALITSLPFVFGLVRGNASALPMGAKSNRTRDIASSESAPPSHSSSERPSRDATLRSSKIARSRGENSLCDATTARALTRRQRWRAAVCAAFVAVV
ncbi:hypothetical protein PUN28_020661 [Cardiocondyla obscurior]|uniref:Uncharacterized protein n=1 Tax=Cardiocondyla obscurior TaxID=286306 RepID=A0AAW2E6X0_9HYME